MSMDRLFKIEDIFDIRKVYGKPLKEYSVGLFPYVTGASDNNGIVGYVDAPLSVVSRGNCLSVDPITGKTCYQPVDFVGRGFSGASINLLYNEHIDETIGLYLCASVEKVAKSVASYTNLFNSVRLASAEIRLPVISDGTPDWGYMRERIEELERERIEELDAYLRVTGLNDYVLTEEDKKVLSLSLSLSRIRI